LKIKPYALLANMFIILTVIAGQGHTQTKKLYGKFIYIKNTVLVNRDGEWKKAKFFSNVYFGDKIATLEDARAEIKSVKGTVIKINPMTTVQLTETIATKEYLSTTLEIENGSAFAKVIKQIKGKKFQMKSPTALAGVRGTEFSMSFDKKEFVSDIMVFDGEVLVKDKFNQSISIRRGNRILVRKRRHRLKRQLFNIRKYRKIWEGKQWIIDINKKRKLLKEKINNLKRRVKIEFNSIIQKLQSLNSNFKKAGDKK